MTTRPLRNKFSLFAIPMEAEGFWESLRPCTATGSYMEPANPIIGYRHRKTLLAPVDGSWLVCPKMVKKKVQLGFSYVLDNFLTDYL